MDNIESIIREVSGKDSSVLCREVTSIGDTMDVLRSKTNCCPILESSWSHDETQFRRYREQITRAFL